MSLLPTGLFPWGRCGLVQPAACDGGPGATGTRRAARGPGARPAPRRAGHGSGRASPPASGTHTAVNSLARCNRAKLVASRRSVLMRSPARLGDQRRRHHHAVVPQPRQLTLDAVAAPAGLVAEPQPRSVTAELARPAAPPPPACWRSGHTPAPRRVAHPRPPRPQCPPCQHQTRQIWYDPSRPVSYA